MIVSFRVHNQSKSRIPFAFVCVNRRIKGSMSSDAINPGNIVFQKCSEKEYDPGEVVVIQFQWPFDKFTPFSVIWKARPDLARKWWVQEAKVDDEPLVMMPGFL